MDLIRCFVAVEIPGNLKQKIDQYIISLKQISPKIKWVKAKNLHITLKFLGEIQVDLLNKVKHELSGISKIVKPFQMSLHGSGFFPNQNNPRIVWLGLQSDNDNLIFKLHEWIDKKLETLGFNREKRRFSPHLTTGRIKIQDNIPELANYINQNKFQSSAFNVDQIVLMKSELKPSGAEYSKLETYSFEV